MALRLLSWKSVENEKRDLGRREVTGVRRREDRFDAILRWVHRLLNPPTPSPVAVSGRRRVRDRVPI